MHTQRNPYRAFRVLLHIPQNVDSKRYGKLRGCYWYHITLWLIERGLNNKKSAMFNHLNFLLFELLFKMYNFLFTLNNRIKKKKCNTHGKDHVMRRMIDCFDISI